MQNREDTLQISSRCHREIRAHVARVRSIEFSADLEAFISASDDGTAKIWQLRSMDVLQSLVGHTDWVRHAIFTPNAQYALSASDDLSVGVWDLHSATLVTRFKGHRGRVINLTACNDNKHVLSGSYDRKILIWDFLTGRIVASLSGHKGWITRLLPLSDQEVLSACNDGTLKLWDIDKKLVAGAFPGHRGRDSGIHAMAVSVSKAWAASGVCNGELKVWKVPSFEELAAVRSHTSPVAGLAFFNNDRRLLSASEDGQLKLWSVPDLTLLWETTLGAAVTCLAVVPNTTDILVGNFSGDIALYRLQLS